MLIKINIYFYNNSDKKQDFKIRNKMIVYVKHKIKLILHKNFIN